MDTRSETTVVSAQVPTELRDLLVRQAHDADRTLSAEIRRALTAHTQVRAGRAPRSDTRAPATTTAGASVLDPERQP